MDIVETIKVYRSLAEIRKNGGEMEQQQGERFAQVADWLEELIDKRLELEILKYGI